MATPENVGCVHPRHIRLRIAAFSLATAAVVAASRALPAARSSAVCRGGSVRGDADAAAADALLATYCATSALDTVAQLTALASGTVTLMTGVLHLVVSRRKYDALLKSVLASLSAVFALVTLTFAMQSPALGLDLAPLAGRGGRPFVYMQMAAYLRWFFVFPCIDSISRRVSVLVEGAERRVITCASASGGSAGASASGSSGEGGNGGGAGAGAPPPLDCAPHTLARSDELDAAVSQCTCSGGGVASGSGLLPSFEWVTMALVVGTNAAARLSRGGVLGLLLNVSAAGLWAVQFLMSTLVAGGALQHNRQAATAAAATAEAAQPATGASSVLAAAASTAAGNAATTPTGRGTRLASPLSEAARRLASSGTEDVSGVSSASAGGGTMAAQVPMATMPAAALEEHDRYSGLVVAFAKYSGLATAVDVACECSRAFAPLSPWGVRLVVAVEAAHLVAELFEIVILPLARLLALVLLFQDTRDLEERVALRVAAVSEKAETAARAAEARRRLMRAIFHELRSPGNAITLGLEALRDWRGMRPEEVDELVAMLAGSASTSTSILNTVLSLAALESGSFAVTRAPTSLRAVAAQVQWQLRPWAASIGAALELELDDALPPLVVADGPRLCQVLTNYVSNALKHCPQDGSGRVAIAARRLDGGDGSGGGGRDAGAGPAVATTTTPAAASAAHSPSRGGRRSASLSPLEAASAPRSASSRVHRAAAGVGAGGGATSSATVRVRLSVTDNGPGIPHEAQRILFRPFVMLVPPRVAPPQPVQGAGAAGRLGREFHPQGTGLGLSIAREIVAAHGGSVGVDSEPGNGATFWADLTLPVVTEDNGVVAGAAHASPPHALAVARPALVPALLPSASLPAQLPLALTTSAPTAASAAATAAAAASLTALAPTEPAPAARRFLVVDDAASNRKILSRLMRSRWPSAVVDEGADGADAADAIKRRLQEDPCRPLSRAYDALVIDCHMARVSGYEAVRRIRELEARAAAAVADDLAGGRVDHAVQPPRRLLIIGVTGDAAEEDQAAFRDAGADVALVKPVDAAAMWAAIERHWVQQAPALCALQPSVRGGQTAGKGDSEK